MKKRSVILSVFLCMSLMLLSSPPSFAKANEIQQISALKMNQSGETYGSALFSPEEPDLVAAVATNGLEGYVRRADLEGPVPASPEEALASQEDLPPSIPVYKEDGETTIGEFMIYKNDLTYFTVNTPQIVPYGKAYGNTKYFTVNGRQYLTQAHVHAVVGYGHVQSRVKVGATSGSSLPAGHFGVFARLFNSAGRLVVSSGYEYTSSPCISVEMPASYNTSSGSYYADGYVRVWNTSTSSYSTQYTPQSPMQTMS